MPNYDGNLVGDLYFVDNNTLNEFVKNYEVGNTIKSNAYLSTTKIDSYNNMANVRIYIHNSKRVKIYQALDFMKKFCIKMIVTF